VLRSVLAAHASLRGSESLDRVFSYTSLELAEALRHVNAANWYPIVHYVALWDAIESEVGNGPDYSRAVRRRCIEPDLDMFRRPVFAPLSTSILPVDCMGHAVMLGDVAPHDFVISSCAWRLKGVVDSIHRCGAYFAVQLKGWQSIRATV
jgi:hypothetical protein